MKTHKRKKTKKVQHIHISHENLCTACHNLPIAVPAHAMEALATYLQLLMRWNSVMNLVGARTWQECLKNLIIDSLYLADFLKKLPLTPSPHSWDLGAGAGLPSIPLRLFWTQGTYTLVEIREKRALFLSTALAQIPLPQTHVFRGSAESFFEHTKHKADLIMSRAFMPWQNMLELIAPHIHADGRIIFLTLTKAPRAGLLEKGWKLEAEYSYAVGQDKRWFWALEKL